MFSCPKILFLVSLTFCSTFKLNPYLPFEFLIFLIILKISFNMHTCTYYVATRKYIKLEQCTCVIFQNPVTLLWYVYTLNGAFLTLPYRTKA